MRVGSPAGSGEGFDYMHAEDMQREDEAAADAYMAELAESAAPACYLPQLAALIQRPGAHRMITVSNSTHDCGKTSWRYLLPNVQTSHCDDALTRAASILPSHRSQETCMCAGVSGHGVQPDRLSLPALSLLWLQQGHACRRRLCAASGSSAPSLRDSPSATAR